VNVELNGIFKKKYIKQNVKNSRLWCDFFGIVWGLAMNDYKLSYEQNLNGTLNA